MLKTFCPAAEIRLQQDFRGQQKVCFFSAHLDFKPAALLPRLTDCWAVFASLNL